MQNPFINDVSTYKRDLNLTKATIQQIAKYVSLKLKIPYEDAVRHVKEEMKERGEFAIHDPEMTRLDRVRPGDREMSNSTLLTYIHDIVSNDLIVSPSMSVYDKPSVNKSVTADWLDTNIAGRKKAKNRMFELRQQGDHLGAQLADYDQNARKIRINSVSGMRGFKGCSLFLETGHSSLTSMCRAAAGYGNGTVERYLGGCRHYHTPEIAKANIVAILVMEDEDVFTPVIEKYNLKYPTTEDVIAMITRSSELYWQSETEMDNIREVVDGMTPLEKAIYLYTGDMYHMALLNPLVIRTFLTDMVALDIDHSQDIDAFAMLKTVKGADRAYVNSLCADIMSGKTAQDLEQNPEEHKFVARTAKAVEDASIRYTDLIKAFFIPKHLPPTVASIRDIQRRRGLIADTDSSIFTTSWWVKWMTGDDARGEVPDKYWYLATHLVCQCIAHSMAQLSANVGVEVDMTFRLAMKNEYGFPVMGVVPIAKHYFGFISIQEGNVYTKYKKETKGVELRGSTTPKNILKAQEELSDFILHCADKNIKMSARDLLKTVADYEMIVMRSILAGDYTYLRSAQIKPDTINMIYFELWQDVFGPKYGESTPVPIPTVVISTELENKTKLQEWLNSIEDKEFAARMRAWLTRHARDKLPTIPLPYQAIRKSGLPIEVQSAANLRKLVYKTCSGFYRLLETTGLYVVDRNYRQLVHEYLDLDPLTAPIDVVIN